MDGVDHLKGVRSKGSHRQVRNDSRWKGGTQRLQDGEHVDGFLGNGAFNKSEIAGSGQRHSTDAQEHAAHSTLERD